eukprot:NODE_2925_length_500_cov_193.139690_g2317_i0.p1 GENE.NODE_2925_length_500_cov_193.139690_g2317_i0~~NODE_2925_length_500_cov_193.139690_g2317_i0.p1  ORF type:complete len:78 (+),score=50.95 NODE_2925_length_500_cov_193.139690_g2317_i0:179-412(+)
MTASICWRPPFSQKKKKKKNSALIPCFFFFFFFFFLRKDGAPADTGSHSDSLLVHVKSIILGHYVVISAQLLHAGIR